MKHHCCIIILLSNALNIVASTKFYVYLQLCDKHTNTLTSVHTEYWLHIGKHTASSKKSFYDPGVSHPNYFQAKLCRKFCDLYARTYSSNN